MQHLKDDFCIKQESSFFLAVYPSMGVIELDCYPLLSFFGQIDKYFTPFISPTSNNGFTQRELNDILPEHNLGMTVVPQILTNNAEYFIRTVNELTKFGYDEVNLNLGCPSGTVVAKYKGSGFLAQKELLDEFLEDMFKDAFALSKNPVCYNGDIFNAKDYEAVIWRMFEELELVILTINSLLGIRNYFNLIS